MSHAWFWCATDHRCPLWLQKKETKQHTKRENSICVLFWNVSSTKGLFIATAEITFSGCKESTTDKTIFKHFTYFFFSFKISKWNTNFASLNLQHICYNGMLLSSNALLILRLKNVFNSWRLALNKNREQNDAHGKLFTFFSCISVFLSFFVLTTISCLVLDIFFSSNSL